MFWGYSFVTSEVELPMPCAPRVMVTGLPVVKLLAGGLVLLSAHSPVTCPAKAEGSERFPSQYVSCCDDEYINSVLKSVWNCAALRFTQIVCDCHEDT